MQSAMSVIRNNAATVAESASPVPTATYAATQIGHFGMIARIALGRTAPAKPMNDRRRGRVAAPSSHPDDSAAKPCPSYWRPITQSVR